MAFLIIFLYTLEKVGYKIFYLTLILTATSGILMTSLFYSLHQNI